MYILNPQQQIKLIRQMTLTRKDNDLNEAYYYHPQSEEMWKSFFPEANEHQLGMKLLRNDPVPEPLDKWLKECLNNGNVNDAYGLGIELSTSPEKWERIIDIIEDNYRQYKRKHLRTFLKKIQIEDYKNLFNRRGYSSEETGIKSETLDQLSRRSKKIRFKRIWFF